MSVVVPIVPVLVPPDAVNAIVAPPVVRLFPAASFAWRVRVAAAPEEMTPLDVVTTDVAAEIAPGVTAIVGIAVPTGVPFTVAPIVVAVPANTPVKVAV